ncbi:MAG: VPLPA-CTERM sorting domain-containing protein [Paracoccaceae bacterium]
MSKFTQLVAAGATTFLLAVPTMALSATTFSGGSFGLSGDAFSDPGLVVNTNPNGGGPIADFSLNEGNSTTFSLFSIWTEEGSVENGEDTVPQAISVAFNFLDPAAGGSLGGETVGDIILGGILQEGEVTWDAPLELMFGDGGLFMISLSDATFNFGIGGLWPGEFFGANIEATVTLISDAAPVAAVPLPATALLLVSALGGLGFMSRRRRAA